MKRNNSMKRCDLSAEEREFLDMVYKLSPLQRKFLFVWFDLAAEGALDLEHPKVQTHIAEFGKLLAEPVQAA
jgi:hypothetical protein